MSSPQENFWQFSNRIYRRPGVADACLDLQNREGADVNLVLFACWFGVTRGMLPEELVARSVHLSQQWSQQVVVKLRHARSWMKTSAALLSEADSLLPQYQRLRDQIKATELQAEHLQQNLLESLLDACTAGSADATIQEKHVRANLRHYLSARTSPAVLQLLSDNAIAAHQEIVHRSTP
jgi:uncharacterized protein (TIGR02444 family)